jgi:hypothetical protein
MRREESGRRTGMRASENDIFVAESGHYYSAHLGSLARWLSRELCNILSARTHRFHREK